MQVAIVTAYTANYADGYKALVNSIEATNPGIPIYTAGPDFDPAEFPHYSDRQRTAPWYAKGARHKLARAVAEKHDATLILDADMLILTDLSMFFEVCAKAEVLIGVSNGSNIYYTDRPYITEPFYHPRTISNVPLFVPRRYAYLYDLIHDAFARHHAAEFDVTNCVIYRECLDRLLVLPPQNWTNIHHFMLRPDTSVNVQHGHLIAQGMPVHAMHGKLWQEGYREGLLRTMDTYFSRWQSTKGPAIARAARDLMVTTWEKYRP